MLIPDHHDGFIDWATWQANQVRIGANTRPVAHAAGEGAVREGTALLQGIAVCGDCGRKLAVFYQGRAKSTPGYYCTGTGQLVEGRGVRHLRVGGVGIDAAVADAFLAALAPAGLEACLDAAEQLETGVDTALAQWRREVERARYQTRARPSGATWLSIRTIGWSPAAWKPTGRRRCRHWPTPRLNSPAAKPSAPEPLPRRRKPRYSRSARTSPTCGTRPPRPIGTAKNCCAPCWRR